PDQPTTQVPQTNLTGQTPDEVQQSSQDFEQYMRRVENDGLEQVTAEENAGPPLTTTKLRQTEPEKAALLEANGIFEVPATQMVVQYDNGRVSLIPQRPDAPEGATIITYGGDTPRERPDGSWGDFASTVMDVMERPQRLL